MRFSLGFTVRIQNARKRKRSTQCGGCRVTERRCGWCGTRGAASCDGGRSRSRGGDEGSGGGGKGAGGGEDRNEVVDRAVSQSCFVVGMRSQREMTSHDPTFARQRWHDIKTARGTLNVHVTCHNRGFCPVESNRRSFPFGGTRGVFLRLCNCAVLSPFLHLPHSSLRLEYLSVHGESVYRRLHAGGDQYTQNSARSTEGKPKEQQLKSWVKSINIHERVLVLYREQFLRAVKPWLAVDFSFWYRDACPGTVTLRWPRANSSPRYMLGIRVYIRLLVCNFVAFIFQRYEKIAWQLSSANAVSRCVSVAGRVCSAHVQSCLASNLSAFLYTILQNV